MSHTLFCFSSSLPSSSPSHTPPSASELVLVCSCAAGKGRLDSLHVCFCWIVWKWDVWLCLAYTHHHTLSSSSLSLSCYQQLRNKETDISASSYIFYVNIHQRNRKSLCLFFSTVKVKQMPLSPPLVVGCNTADECLWCPAAPPTNKLLWHRYGDHILFQPITELKGVNTLFKALQGSTNMCSRSSRRTEAVWQFLNLWCDNGAPEAAELEPLTELISYKGAGLRLQPLFEDAEKDGTEQQKQTFLCCQTVERRCEKRLYHNSHILFLSVDSQSPPRPEKRKCDSTER